MELRQKFKEEQIQREKVAAKKRMKLGSNSTGGGYSDYGGGGCRESPSSAPGGQQTGADTATGASSGKPPKPHQHRQLHMSDEGDTDDWHHPNRLDAFGLRHKDSVDAHDPHAHLKELDPTDVAGISPAHSATNQHNPADMEAMQFAREPKEGVSHHSNALPHHHHSHPQGQPRHPVSVPAPVLSSSAQKFADSNLTSVQGSRRDSEISLEGLDVHLKPLTAPVIHENSVTSIPPNTIPIISQVESEVGSVDGNSLDGAIDLTSVGNSLRDLASKASTKEHIHIAVTQSPTDLAPSGGSTASSYQAKLDMIDSMMLENSREIRSKNYTSAAAEILDKYSTKFSASGDVVHNNENLAVAAGINKALADGVKTSSGEGKRKKATKNVTLNDVIKFPTINTSNSFESKHVSGSNGSSTNGVGVNKNKKMSQSASTSVLRHSNSARGLGWKRNNP